MDVSESEALLSRHHGQAVLDAAYVAALRRALLAPQSANLRALLAMAEAAGTYDLTQLDGARPLMKQGMETEPHLFHAEALERAAIASALSGRLRNGPLEDPIFFAVWQVCERCVVRYKDLEPGFSDADTDRLLRAATLASEDIGASNLFTAGWKYLQPAFAIPEDVRNDPERAALYRSLIERLERAEAETRGNDARRKAAQAVPEAQRTAALVAARAAERFFDEKHYAMLAALRRAVGATGASQAETARNADQAERNARRVALVASLSPLWRDTFEFLLDIPYVDDTLPQTLMRHPALEAIDRLDDTARGVILAELVALRTTHPDNRGGTFTPPEQRLDALGRPGGQASGRIGFATWAKLAALAALLAKRGAELDDAAMARTLAQAQEWRPLCDFGLLDSAERTLARGPAPLTLAALGALATRPSHCFMPGDAGPDYEGDTWWNGAPPRARALMQRYRSTDAAPPPPPRPVPPSSGLVRRVFGRRGIGDIPG